jgi:hypothetical protein
MDAQAYSRMRPLYEAMTVCSAAIEWFERQERERTAWSLQSNLGDLVRVMEEFTAAASERDLFAGASTELISGSVYCLEIELNDSTRHRPNQAGNSAPLRTLQGACYRSPGAGRVPY